MAYPPQSDPLAPIQRERHPGTAPPINAISHNDMHLDNVLLDEFNDTEHLVAPRVKVRVFTIFDPSSISKPPKTFEG